MTEPIPSAATPAWPVQPYLPVYAPLPPPRRRRAFVLAIVGTILATGIIAGVDAFAAGVAVRHHDTTSPKRPPATSVRIGDSDALRTYLVARPAWDTARKIVDSTFGVQTPSQFVNAHYRDPTYELAQMTARQFVIASLEAWNTPGGDQITIQLLQFRSAAGAESYALANGSAYGNEASTTDAIAHVADGHVYTWNDPDKYGNRRVAVLGRLGNVALLLDTYTPGAAQPDAELTLFKQQYTALTP
jgi:hypothetical protein